jgi:hypothetical protein
MRQDVLSLWRMGGRRGAMIELREQGAGLALKAVAPVGEAEAQAEAGEDRGEVVDSVYCTGNGVW